MTQRGGFQDRKYAVVNIKMTEVFRDVGPDDTAFQLNLCMPVQSSTEVVPQVDVGAVGAVGAVSAVGPVGPVGPVRAVAGSPQRAPDARCDQVLLFPR